MRVSAAQYFAMSEAQRQQVTYIDTDLDKEAERRPTWQEHWRQADKDLMEVPAEPGSDWTDKDQAK